MKKIHDMHLGLQFNHCVPRKVLTVVPWKLLTLLSKVKWNCSLSEQHWENKGICSWLLINAKRDQHKGVRLAIHHVGNLTRLCACRLLPLCTALSFKVVPLTPLSSAQKYPPYFFAAHFPSLKLISLDILSISYKLFNV